jgi:hypothetical protein
MNTLKNGGEMPNFDEIYSDVKKHYMIKGEISTYVKTDENLKCFVCKKPTSWFDLLMTAPICSEECADKLWDGYFKTTYKKEEVYTMTQEEFKVIFDEIIKELHRKNDVKGNEYARNNDRFHNFRHGALLTNLTLPKYLMSLRSKHEVSIIDMVDDIDRNVFHQVSLWKEKITDSIMYLILLYAYVKSFLSEIDDSGEL